MNFRLLSREAVMNSKRLSIVSGDAAVRSLAASAGLPVFGSVGEYESSLAESTGSGGAGAAGADESDDLGGATPGSGAGSGATTAAAATAAGTGTTSMDAGLAASATVVIPTVEPAGPTAAPAGGRKSQRPRRPVDTDTTAIPTAIPTGLGAAAPMTVVATPPTRPIDGRTAPSEDAATGNLTDLPPILGGRIRAPAVIAIGLVALALIVGGVGAYVFLPSASITVTPRRDALAPIVLTVGADPAVTVVDPDTSVVPAVRLDVPVEAARTFTTTGKHVEETVARGSVTFTNYDTSSGVSIPSGSIVSTEGGVRFRTQGTVALQPASIFPAFEPKSDSVAVSAVRPVSPATSPANTIRVVPQGQDPVLLRVNNRAETSGGTHTETPEITQAEVDNAVAALQVDLQTAFADAVAAGAGAPPNTTLFPDTATPGVATPDVDPKTLVGQALVTFDLRLTAVGTVIAVDPSPVRTIARAELEKHLTADHRLLEDTVSIDVGEGSVGEDGQVTFQATVRATQVLIVDAASLPGLVKGKTKAEAEAVLARFGTAHVTLWPEWVSTVTTLDARISAIVEDATVGIGPGGASPSPGAGSAAPRPSPTPARSTAPAGSRSPGSPAASAPPP